MLQDKIKLDRQQYLTKHRSEVQKILDHWGVGKIVRIDTDIPGWVNLNSLVETANGKFFLRLTYPERRESQDIEAEIRALTHLKDQGIPVITPLPTLDHKNIVEGLIEDNLYFSLLFPLAPGKNVNLPNASQIFSIGEMLGRLHHSFEGFPINIFRRKFDFMDELTSLDQRIRDKFQYQWPYPEIIQEEHFKQLWDTAFNNFSGLYHQNEDYFQKQMLSHGDFHHENLRFDGNKIVAVLDFDNLMLAPRAFDISISIHHNLKLASQVKAVEAKTVFQRLVEGYEKVHKLDQTELDIVLWLTQYWLWTHIPWLHYYSGEIPGHRETQAQNFGTILAGIHKLEAIRLNK